MSLRLKREIFKLSTLVVVAAFHHGATQLCRPLSSLLLPADSSLQLVWSSVNQKAICRFRLFCKCPYKCIIE